MRNRITGREVDRLRVGSERVGDLREMRVVAISEQQAVDTIGVDELARCTRADRAGADDKSCCHYRKSGPSSSRQPPLVGGTPPFPRSRARAPIAPASPITNSKRRKAFTARSVSAASCIVPGAMSSRRPSSLTVMDAERVSESITIEAGREAVFAVLADPSAHTDIDGTGWVRAALDGERITAMGQV